MESEISTLSRTDRARAWILAVRARFKTIILGTASPEGDPDASVAGAILCADGSFCIYVSDLAVHTRHLLAAGRASVLLVEDESLMLHPLARQRLTFACTAEAIARHHPEYASVMLALREKFGPTFDLLAGLGGFQLFRLAPQSGRFVAGFGESYAIDPQDWAQLSPLGRPRG